MAKADALKAQQLEKSHRSGNNKEKINRDFLGNYSRL